MEYLAYYERIRAFVLDYWNYTKTKSREWLGPEPVRWNILPDGRILSPSIILPPSVQAQTYVYSPETHRLTLHGQTEGRYRPLPFLSLKITNEIVGSIDISDWVGDIRANPVPTTITPLQLLTLWSFVTNNYVPCRNVTLSWANQDGEEESEVIP